MAPRRKLATAAQVRVTLRSPARDQIEDQNDQSNDQNYMDQPTAHVKAEPQKPQDEQNNDNGPQHIFSPPSAITMGVSRHDDRSLPETAGNECLQRKKLNSTRPVCY